MTSPEVRNRRCPSMEAVPGPSRGTGAMESGAPPPPKLLALPSGSGRAPKKQVTFSGHLITGSSSTFVYQRGKRKKSLGIKGPLGSQSGDEENTDKVKCDNYFLRLPALTVVIFPRNKVLKTQIYLHVFSSIFPGRTFETWWTILRLNERAAEETKLFVQ